MKTTINFPKNLVERQYNSTIVSILATLVIVGIMLILSHNIINFEDDTPMSLLITGGVFVTIVLAIVLSFSLKREVLASCGTPLVCKVIDFKDSEYNSVVEAIAENRWAEIKNIAKSDEGIAMKIEMVYSKDRIFAAYQFFKYVPHSYEPCSEIVYLDKRDVTTIANA